MTSSAFPFLDGRSALDGPVVRASRRGTWHRNRALSQVPLRFRRSRPVVARPEGDGRDTTDAYRDRTRASSVDWADTLLRHAQR